MKKPILLGDELVDMDEVESIYIKDQQLDVRFKSKTNIIALNSKSFFMTKEEGIEIMKKIMITLYDSEVIEISDGIIYFKHSDDYNGPKINL